MGIENGAIVLDPWNGSGTTSLVASALGGKSIGVDLNPFASLIAAAKHISPDDAEAAATTAGSS
ncbi:MAG: DNA methyltransferase [Myxococcota bacterium]